MSEGTPDRSISGLPPRGKKRDLSGMLASNRVAPTEPVTNPDGALPPADTEPEPVSEVTPTATAAKKAIAPAPRRRTTKAATKSNADTAKVQVTAYMSPEVRNRARAAFKFTAAVEGDSSWSEYVEAAVLAETLRREQQHNDGQPYDGGEQRLSPGRSIT